MYAIALYGSLLVVVSLIMILRPDRFVEVGLRYCRSRFMHPLEIAICIGFGAVFVLFGPETGSPTALRAFGYVLGIAGLGVALTPPSIHRRFGIWSLERFRGWFRPCGFLSLLLGAFVLHAVF